MADFYSLRVYGLRALLVALGVLSLFGLKSFMGDNEEIRLSTLDEVTAGSNPELIVQAEPNSTLELELLAPNGIATDFELKTDDSGDVNYRFEPSSLELAGIYTLNAQYERGGADSAVKQDFEVLAGKADLSRSRISFSSSVLNPNQTVQMSVQLMDSYKNPIVGHSLSVTPNSTLVQVFSSEFVTDEKGQINFTVMGNGSGVVELSLFDSTLGETILAPAQIALLGGPAVDDAVYLAESGPVDSFVISGLDSEVETGTEQSVTVKAVDEDGFTVQDYTGTIRFSSSDDQASLPNDYTFLADDQGEHTFSLGVKFVTVGIQTLSVTDIEDIQVNGEESAEVVADSNSSVDYDNDFETTDFERDGEFTLTSPATGSYSESSVEIQGEAEYGYSAVVFVNGEEAGSVDVEYDNSFSYSLEDLEDGDYVVYVEIQDEDDTLIESSDSETITVDTTAPDLVSISADPEDTVEAGSEIVVTVLSEAGLEDSTVVFEEEVTVLEETGTAGKYQATIIAPTAEGQYTVDVFLKDSLGNEVEFRDQLTITVGIASEVTPVDTEPEVTSDLSKVTGLTATGGEELVALSWEAPDSALSIAYYRVYYGPSPTSLFAVSETYDSSTNWTITDLIGDEYYYFAVSAVDIEGNESEESDTVLGVPEASSSSSETPSYPVYTNLEEVVTETPETGPETGALVVLSSLGAMGYILLRKRARA